MTNGGRLARCSTRKGVSRMEIKVEPFALDVSFTATI
jgi:hypothetical protein